MDIKNKKICLNNDVDKISSLPDAILQHILSFVDIKIGVQTCILSKRWRYVWTDIPCLNFNFKPFPDKKITAQERRRNSMVNFMHQVLSKRSRPDIHKFSFFSTIAFDTTRLRSFVDHILQCNVEMIEIDYLNKAYDPHNKHVTFINPFEMPDLMCTSSTLRVLKLNANGKRSIILPRTFSCTTLKELRLEHIHLWDDTSDGELISDSPNLEYLTLVNCDFGELERLKITAPQLANLEILYPSGSGIHASPWKCNIIVSAPNLSSFKFDSHSPLVCDMGDPLNIDTVNINIYKHHTTKCIGYQMIHRMIAMLQEFQHAKSVTVSSRVMKILSYYPRIPDQHSSPFHNLKNIKVNFKDVSVFRGLNYMLGNSTLAKTSLTGSSLRFDIEDKGKQCHEDEH